MFVREGFVSYSAACQQAAICEHRSRPANPGLLPKGVERFFLSLWVGAALTAVTMATVEWQTNRQQLRRVKAHRATSAPGRRRASP